LKRFIRDAGILLAFCGAFYCLTVFVGRLDGESGNDGTDFSPARKRADVYFKRKDWNSASIEFRTLTEQDPFDGNAWYNYSSCFYYLRRSASSELDYLNRQSNPDLAEIEALQESIRFNSDRAQVALLKATEFARSRGRALLRLAVIETAENNYNEALDYLEDFVDDGNHTQEGLSRYIEFGAGGPAMVSLGNQPSDEAQLHGEARFWELVQKESVLRVSY
jgi:tetratricopeptide (TPR) repeat protein